MRVYRRRTASMSCEELFRWVERHAERWAAKNIEELRRIKKICSETDAEEWCFAQRAAEAYISALLAEHPDLIWRVAMCRPHSSSAMLLAERDCTDYSGILPLLRAYSAAILRCIAAEKIGHVFLGGV